MMKRFLKSLLLIPFIASPMAFAQFSEQRLSVDQYKWVGPLSLSPAVNCCSISSAALRTQIESAL
jgi:hypothetical protein